MFNYQIAAEELNWLKDHPWFDRKPASIIEFLGENHLNIDSKVRPGVRQALIDIFGEQVNGFRIAKYKFGMFTGAIGIGKTTMASIVIPYMVHWVLCLKDPQDFYNLMPGSRIAFMQMSTSEDQAKETVFGDIKARIEHSKWFVDNYPMDPAFKNQMRFAKDIWVLPGSSSETSFEGYNILGGILDEADSHKKTKEKDYAEDGFNTINSRIESRYDELGFLLVVGQMKSDTGFAAGKYAEFVSDPDAYTVRMSIWESRGWARHTLPDGTRDSFWYDRKRKLIIPAEQATLLGGASDDILEIPSTYKNSFLNNPEKALRDLAGIPPASGDAFISLTYRLEEARDRWVEHYGMESPVNDNSSQPVIADWFKALDSKKRSGHLDIGYSSSGDAAGIAVGHIDRLVDIEGEEKPYIVIDMIMRVHAPKGQQVQIADLRRVFYELRDERGFKITSISMDGFQSVDTQQQFLKKKLGPRYRSIDKDKGPYEDLRDAIYESRIEWPKYLTRLKPADAEPVEILYKELSSLQDTGKKIDHPVNGSKDVADCVAGVVSNLMGDRTYRRGVRSGDNVQALTREELEQRTRLNGPSGSSDLLSMFGGRDLQAPVPQGFSGFSPFSDGPTRKD